MRQVKDIKMTLFTTEYRIEGIFRVPREVGKGVRLGEVIKNADRASTRVITLVNASIFDRKTNELLRKEKRIGVNMNFVELYIPEEELEEEDIQVWEIS